MLLRAILCGWVWNGFLLGKAKKENVLCRFCGQRDAAMLGNVPFPRLQHVRDLPEFASLMSLNRSNWPRCLLWRGWLPGLCGIRDDDPWGASYAMIWLSAQLERCLGAYPVDFSGSWTPPEYWDADDIALEMADHPNVWTVGSSRGLISSLREVLKWVVLVFICLHQ